MIPAEVFCVSSKGGKEDLNIEKNENHSDDLQAELYSDVVDIITDTCTDKRLNEHQAEVYDSDIFGSKLKDLFDSKRQKNENRKKKEKCK